MLENGTPGSARGRFGQLAVLPRLPMTRNWALDVECRQGTVMTMQLTAVFEKVPEGYIAFVEELPGANTQGATLEEARTNLKKPWSWFWKRIVFSRKRLLMVVPLYVNHLSSFPSEASRRYPT